MVKLPEDDVLFSALANPTRRSILERLREGPRAIGELAEPFDMSLVAVSKHVHTLEEAGLLEIRRRGRSRICTLRPGPLRRPLRWIAGFARFWEAELDQVERWLAGTPDAGDDQAGAPDDTHGKEA